jgi:hypothetical protein
VKAALWLLIIALLKYYFGGARNLSERVMHGKVVIVTVSFSMNFMNNTC